MSQVAAYGGGMTTRTKDKEKTTATPGAATAPAPAVAPSAAAPTAAAPTVATPWGRATVAAQAGVQQRSGERRFQSVVQLLVDERGEPLVRFAYTTDGVARRGPVTLRARDLEKLRAAAAAQPALAALLGWSGGGAAG